MALRDNPLIYEINTWVWLADLSSRYNHLVTLADVPEIVIDELAGWRPDAIWLMGVWERSPRAREIAIYHPDLQAEYQRILPGYTPRQVAGSPYAVHRYTVDSRLGGPDGLAAFRRQLQAHGIRLLLDFVPNHVASDHPWTVEAPECLVLGSEIDMRVRPDSYFVALVEPRKTRVIAHGRDPYFPAWTDTAQVDAFSRAARERSRDALLDIAGQCDGVRCDMAMLLVNRVFAHTWSRHDSDIPSTEFWEAIIPAVKAQRPDFVFVAEVYWDMEAELQSLGFDYTYDKRLYDRMRHENGLTVRDHLLADIHYQRKLVRFIENHDEQRALSAFGMEKSRAAAVLALALPGARLTHEGQFEGRRIKLPVQLGERPYEPVVEPLLVFYQRLTAELSEAPYHDGVYLAFGTRPILNNDAHYEHILAFAWVLGADWRIIVVNFGEEPANGRIMLPIPALAGRSALRFEDQLDPAHASQYSGDSLLVAGLPLELEGYGVRIFRLTVEP